MKIKMFVNIIVLALLVTACSNNEGNVPNKDEGQKQSIHNIQLTESAIVNQSEVEEKEDEQSDIFPLQLQIKDKMITIEQKPERILPMSLDVAEIVLDLVPAESIVAITSSIDNEQLSSHAGISGLTTERISAATNIDPEKILSYQTDLLLLTKTHGQEADAEDVLQAAGVPLLSFDSVYTLDQWYEQILTIGTAVGEASKAEQLVQQYKDHVEHIQKDLPNKESEPTVLILSEVGPGTGPYIMGKSHISYDLLKQAKVKPAIDTIGLERTTQASIEQVLNMNPDYIILLDWQGEQEKAYESIISSPGWDTVDAVKNGNVSVLPVKYLFNLNKMNIEGIQSIVDLVYKED